MEFIIGFPKSKKKNNSMIVVVDKLSNDAHFILVKSTYKVVHIAYIFLKENFRHHHIFKTIISHRDAKFIGIWKALFKQLVHS